VQCAVFGMFALIGSVFLWAGVVTGGATLADQTGHVRRRSAFKSLDSLARLPERSGMVPEQSS
jgi:hypothetical protein